MNCYSITVGSRNRVAAAATFTKDDDDTIRSVTARYFPAGSTILNANGAWYDPVAKTYIEEQSRQILVCANNIAELKPWYNDLIYKMQQKALMLVDLGPANFIIADPNKLIAMATGVRAVVATGTQVQPPKTTIT